MTAKGFWLGLGVALMALGCGGATASKCRLMRGGDGSATITCDDGTTATVRPGTPGKDSAPGTSSLVRLDEEPPGMHCSGGGTQVRSGLDLDGNGTLEDPEVTSTAYLCRPEASTMPPPPPPSNVCSAIEGDYHVETSLDATLFEMLGCTEIHGSLIIEGALTSLAPFHRLTQVAGNLSIRAAVADLGGLDALRSVGGDLHLTGVPSLAGLGALEQVGGDFTVEGSVLTSLTGLERLVSVGNALTLPLGTVSSLAPLGQLATASQVILTDGAYSDLTGLGRLTIETLAIGGNRSLVSLGGAVALSIQGLLVEDAPLLTTLGGVESMVGLSGLSLSLTSVSSLAPLAGHTLFGLRLDQNAQLVDLTGLQLNAMVSTVTLRNNAITDLGALASVQSVVDALEISEPGVTSLAPLSAITSIGGTLVIGSTQVASLDGLAPLSVGGEIVIDGNGALSSLAGMSSWGLSRTSSVSIRYNLALTSLTGLEGVTELGNLQLLQLDGLTSLQGLSSLTGVFGDLAIAYNDQLASLAGLEALTYVQHDLSIDDNPLLPYCEVLRRDQMLSVGGDRRLGNNGPAPQFCP